MDSTRDRWLPVAAAAAIAVVGAIEVALAAGYADHRPTASLVVAIAVAGLAAGAWWPVAGTAVVAAMFPVAVLGGLTGPTGAGVFALLLSPGWAGYRVPARRSWPAPLLVQLTASVGTFLVGGAAGSDVGGLGAQVWENLFFTLICWGAWGVGVLARRLRERAEVLARLAAALDAEREARERAVVVEERQRIAREVHDVVAHSISVMVLQLGAVRTTMEVGSPQAEVLLGVERLGRESVQELRTLVGILRETPDGVPPPQPTLTRAADLAAEVRAAGLPVELRTEGDVGGLPRGLDLSAYRIVQEALTNVLRHAGPVPTTVLLRREPDVLTVEVQNEPPAAAPAPATGGGHGLVGMRERVSVFEGALHAGPRPDGGFAVRARFPLGARR